MNFTPSLAAGQSGTSKVRAERWRPPPDKARRNPLAFAPIPHQLADDPRLLPATDLAAVRALLSYAHNDCSTTVSDAALARRMRVSLATAKRSLVRLDRSGWIRRDHQAQTDGNPTGRVLVLLWRLPGFKGPKPPDVPPDASVKSLSMVAHQCATPSLTSELPPSLTSERQLRTIVVVEEPAENLIANSEISSLNDNDGDDKTTQAEPEPQPEPQPAAPAPTAEPGTVTLINELFAAREALLSAFTPDERARFDHATPAKQEQLVDMLKMGMVGMARSDLPRKAPKPIPLPNSTAEMILALGQDGCPREWIQLAIRAIAVDFGETKKDGKLWPAFAQLLTTVYQRGFPAEAVADAYRQGMNPKSKNRGAVFNTALKANGWLPKQAKGPAS